MKPLKKGYEASEENVHVKIAGKIYRCANLKKSGILIQSKILIAHNDEWHEIDIIGLGADKTEKFIGLQNSNLQNFKTLVETKNLSPNFLNFSIEESIKNYELTHEDRMRLDVKFGFSYIYIEKLESHLKRFGHKTGEHAVSQILKYLKKQGRTIQEYIACETDQANEIINNSNKLIKMSENTTIQGERIEYLTALGFVYEENPLPSYIMRYGTVEAPSRFEVSLKSIEEDSDEDWNKLVERIEFSVPSIAEQEVTEIAEAAKEIIENKNTDLHEQFDTENPAPLPATPISETPVKKPVSLAVIGSLTPDRIAEFASLKENQEKIVKDNPFIEPTDKASFEKAKKAAAALLKASTAIDSPKEGIKANKNKFLKQLSGVLDNFLDPLAKMTRNAYDKQALANKTWENKEALRIQNEEKEKLAKVNARTQSLFDVPMVFNGTHYTIGTLHIMPSQITSATDEDFNALVVQAQGIKSGLDAAAAAENEKDLVIKQLQEQLAKLMKTDDLVNSNGAAEGIKGLEVNIPKEGQATVLVNQPAAVKTLPVGPTQTTSPPTTVIAGELIYSAPSEDNKLLLAFDLENLAHVEKQAFLKCRSYYIKGLQDAGKEIVNIFENPAIPKKAEPLKELGTILKNS